MANHSVMDIMSTKYSPKWDRFTHITGVSTSNNPSDDEDSKSSITSRKKIKRDIHINDEDQQTIEDLKHHVNTRIERIERAGRASVELIQKQAQKAQNSKRKLETLNQEISELNAEINTKTIQMTHATELNQQHIDRLTELGNRKSAVITELNNLYEEMHAQLDAHEREQKGFYCSRKNFETLDPDEQTLFTDMCAIYQGTVDENGISIPQPNDKP